MKIKLLHVKVTILVSLMVLFASCDSNESYTFEAKFNEGEKNLLKGHCCSAKPISDWQLSNQRIEFLTSNTSGEIGQEIYAISPKKGDVKMEVDLGILNEDVLLNGNGWIGFSIGGAHLGQTDAGSLNLGVNTNGMLFIGKPNEQSVNKSIQKQLLNGVRLQLKIAPKDEDYSVRLALVNPDSNEVLEQISKTKVASKKMEGTIKIIADFHNTTSAQGTHTSVWFDNWKIGGTKVSAYKD